MRLIDADTLVETFEKNARIAARFGSNAPAFRYLELAFAVSNAPTADAVPVRHGKWLPYIVRLTRSVKGGMYEKGLQCSLCNYKDGDEEYAYCPRCGAKMDKVKP